MPVPLVFSTPEQQEPVLGASFYYRDNCPDAVFDPIDGGMWILKTGNGEISLYLQKREQDGTWGGVFNTVYSGALFNAPFARGFSRIAIDSGGNIMTATYAASAMRTRFIPRDTSPDIDTDHGDNQIEQVMLNLQVVGQKIVLTYNVVRPSNGYYDMAYKVWDTATKTWGSEVNLGHPSDDVPGTARGIYEGSVDQSTIDGKFHAAVVAKVGSGTFNGAIWYKWFDPIGATEGTWSQVRSPGVYPTEDRWPTIWASNISPDRIYISVWRIVGGGVKASSGDLLIGDGVTWSSTQFSESTTRSVMSPRCILDYDDSVYFLWAEYNTGTGYMAVYARGCDSAGNMDAAPEHIADSLWNIYNVFTGPPGQTDRDPEFPCIVRPQRSKALTDLVALWGDTYAVNPSSSRRTTWMSTAVVAEPPPEEEEPLKFVEGVGGILSNGGMVIADGQQALAWLKWGGVDA